jgi:uncharacterized protein
MNTIARITFAVYIYGLIVCPVIASDFSRKYAKLKSNQVERKAEKGDPDAQYELGYRYARGHKDEITQDKSKAAEWYRMAAESGHVLGMHDLAYVLSTSGEGVELDTEEAFQWYLRAAEAGNDDSMVRVGNFFQYGRGAHLDTDKAVSWYREAVKKGNELAPLYMIGMHLRNEYAFPPEELFTYAEMIAEDKAPVRQQFGTRSAQPGDRVGQRVLGDLYLNGIGTRRNLSAAVKWYKKAAEQGDIQAQATLARLYETGQGTAKSPNLAFKWYLSAATSDFKQGTMNRRSLLDSVASKLEAQNDPVIVATGKAGEMLIEGIGTKKDVEKGFELIKKASELGNLDAMYALGMLFWGGENVQQDQELAVELFRNAAAENHEQSIEALSKFGIEN